MRAACLVVAGVLATATQTRAVPPHFCGEVLDGELASATHSFYGWIRLRLIARDDLAALTMHGRYRCLPRTGLQACILQTGRFHGLLNGDEPHAGRLGNTVEFDLEGPGGSYVN